MGWDPRRPRIQFATRSFGRIGRSDPGVRPSPAGLAIGQGAATTLPIASRRASERHEIAIERRRRGPVDVVADKEVTHDLPHSSDLPKTRSDPSRVRHGQIQQFQGPIEGGDEAHVVTCDARIARPTSAPAFARALTRFPNMRWAICVSVATAMGWRTICRRLTSFGLTCAAAARAGGRGRSRRPNDGDRPISGRADVVPDGYVRLRRTSWPLAPQPSPA